MKPALLLFLAAFSASHLLGQEVMENSDFSDGTTHWHGDCKPASSDMTTDFTSNSSSSGGLLVELHSSSWTSVTQEIRGDTVAPRSAVLTITYETSPDFKLSDRGSDYGNIGPAVGFGGANVPARQGQITALIDVPPLSRSSVSNNGVTTNVTIYDDLVSAVTFTPSTEQKSQTFTANLNPPPPTNDSHQTFCIAFPPGNGTITITKISMVPGHGGPGGIPLPHYRPPGFPQQQNAPLPSNP